MLLALKSTLFPKVFQVKLVSYLITNFGRSYHQVIIYSYNHKYIIFLIHIFYYLYEY